MRHRKDDGAVVSLTEVVNKARAWEAANNTNTRVMEAQNTDEQVNYISTKWRTTVEERIIIWVL